MAIFVHKPIIGNYYFFSIFTLLQLGFDFYPELHFLFRYLYETFKINSNIIL